MTIKTCWIITEGMAGTENQCIGVAEALGLTPVIKRIKLKSPWKELSPWLSIGKRFAISTVGDNLDSPYPDIVLASGRKAIIAALYVKEASQGKSFIVQIQDPRISPKNFDLVCVPQHDPTRGENVIVTTGALHKVTKEKLKQEKEKFFDKLDYLKKPRVAVLIGGSSKHHKMTREITDVLASQLLGLKDVSLMITASRRTGEENTRLLQEKLKGENIYFWDSTGDNPYFAFLEMADYIIATEDSVSMTSEALYTGKPVYTVKLEGGAKRINNFHKLLQNQGYTKPFSGQLETWSYTIPDDRKKLTDEIIKRISKRG